MSRRRWTRDDGPEVVGVMLLVVAFVAMIGFGVRDCRASERERARCVDNGGEFVQINCRPYEDWVADGDGGHFDSGVACDTICVGASAEDGREP